MDPNEIRRWMESRRAAAERERREVAERGTFVPDPIAASLSLIALAGRLHGWPLPVSEADQREDELARETWDRLRAAWLGSAASYPAAGGRPTGRR